MGKIATIGLLMMLAVIAPPAVSAGPDMIVDRIDTRDYTRRVTKNNTGGII